MIEKVTMPKSVLLDANVIIEAYKLGIWEKLLDRINALVPSTVAHDEALFFRRGKIPQPIDLMRLIRIGKINELSTTVAELGSLQSVFDRVFVQGLDSGELEALALIKADRVGTALYCTGDAAAIRALAMIGHSGFGISMEMLLKETGLQKYLNNQFTEKFFKEKIAEGQENLITGRGLREKKSLQR